LPEAYKVKYTTPSVHFPKAIAICKILHKTSDLATAVKLNTYQLWISFCFWPCTWLTITQYTQSTAHVGLFQTSGWPPIAGKNVFYT